MSDKEHKLIGKLKQQLSDKVMDRREFVRFASLLGMAVPTAYMWAGKITGEDFIPAAAAQDMPKGGIIRIAQRVPKVENPHTFSWVYDSNIARQVCGYLTRTGSDNVTRPHLASKWEASEDLKTWTLTMADATWRKGEPFTAEHAAWNIKHCLDPKVGSSVIGLMKGYLLKEIDTGTKDDAGKAVMTTELWDANAIEVKDAKTLVLNLAQPQVAVPEHLFHYPFLMLDPAENGVFGVGSNGTGSFDLAELEVGRKAVLKRVADKPGFVDEIHFIDLGDNPSAVAAALASKQVDGVYQGNIEQFEIYKAMEHTNLHQVVTAQTGVARMRKDTKPFDNPAVRKAMRLSTDTAKTLQIAHKGVGTPAEHHHVAPVHPDYKKIEGLAYNPEEAKKVLAEGGFPDGIDVEIVCKPDPSWEQAAVEAMAEQWKAGGIRAKINVMPSNKFWEVWDKVPFGFTEWTHRPLGFMVLALAYRTGVPWNESAYSNAQFDELLNKAEGTIDVAARSEILGELEKIMLEDGPIAQPLWRSIYTAYDKRVKGFELHPTLYIFGENLAIEPGIIPASSIGFAPAEKSAGVFYAVLDSRTVKRDCFSMLYARPQTLGEAVAAVADRDGLVLAGGTDIYPAHVGRPFKSDIVDVSGIAELRGISETEAEIRIGGGTTWTDIIRARLPPAFDALKAAAREVGSIQIQNRATIAGNLCNASPAADGVPPLLILDAEVELMSSAGARRLPLSAFITGYRRTARRPDEILSAVIIPKPGAADCSAFIKLGARRYLVISIVMAAALLRIEGQRIAEARVAIGSASAVAQRLPGLERALAGRSLDQPPSAAVMPSHFAALSPIDDVRATAGYRLDAACEIVGRALDLAAGMSARV